jgi:FkbM family methyltransferase
MADRGRVLAIEPSRELAARLRENVRLNSLSSILVREVATGDSRGLAARETSATDHGSAAFTAVAAEQDGTGAVEMMPLLDIVQQAGLDRIDALKVDIEGMEDRALAPFFASAPQRLWPRAVALEISHRKLWQTDVAADLENRGYRVIARGRVDLVFERQPV